MAVPESPREVVLEHGGARVPALVLVPDGSGPHAAVVIAPEAYGLNTYMREVAARLQAAGYVIVLPDYYRGKGLSKPDDYDDFTEVMAAIGGLDFTEATKDILAGIDHARSMAEVDPERVVVWGYCTGGTLALLATALDGRLAGGVWFFPSQPTFGTLDDSHPVHPLDLVWAVRSPVILLYGDQDAMLAGTNADEIERRLTRAGVDHTIRVYAGAGHAFTSPGATLHHEAADRASWADAIGFLRSVTA